MDRIDLVDILGQRKVSPVTIYGYSLTSLSENNPYTYQASKIKAH